MKIDRTLNLVFPVETADGTVHVHSAPISRDVFRQYFDVIGETVAKIHARGMLVIAGPNIASLMLRRVAEDAGRWDDADGRTGVANGLMAEIRRLANVVVPGPQGWTTLPYAEAVRREMFDEATQDAVEGGLVFFTCASALQGFERERLLAMLTISGMLSIWRAQTVSSNCTEYAASLPISTPDESSGETEVAWSATS